MAIVLRLDRMMADRKISLGELAKRVGIADTNLSKIKNGHVNAIRFSTLDAICRELRCQPGDILERAEDGEGTPQHDSSPHLKRRPVRVVRKDGGTGTREAAEGRS